MAKINLFFSGNNRRLTGNVGRYTVYSYRYCPHCMRSRVYVTVLCPSVCLFVRLSVAILCTCMWDGKQDMIYRYVSCDIVPFLFSRSTFSKRLSVPARVHNSKPAPTGLLLWARRADDIDRLLPAAACGGRMWVEPRIRMNGVRRPMVAEYRPV